ncbi:hypothetical protein RSOLAG22IIIB_12248 [Rhizoctonia solani]|uniref:Peptidase C14 caspase domain-containing protein n=1 Tax=Rhizoctonia solani TaxID=456999 RepID=A0A0K6GD92_9AGAM|nr:hypothetical protein RSOLAG22IIIB_12248 [Rhizoctonia solani]
MSVPMSMDAVTQTIESAMQAGDRLPNQASPEVHVERRALVIVAQYHRAGYTDSPTPLWNTPADGANVYRMLRHLGYEAENIRVLCELEESQSPTRDNIIASFHWLTDNTKQGDFRFLHFSGHGGLVESKKGEGKEAREFKLPIWAEGDTPSAEVQAWQSQTLSSQEVPQGELKYFNEVIITSWTANNWFRAQSQNSITDQEMNDILSNLHPGSTLTTTFDCCHSGRMLNNRLKLCGGLCRSVLGKVTTDSSGRIDIRTSSLLVVPETQGDSASASAPTSPRLDDGTPAPDTVPEIIVMSENLPDDEKKMDGIKAKTFSWGACHQSQPAWDYKDWRGGFFTNAFTALVIGATNDTTIREVFTRTDDAIKDTSIQSNRQVPQFCQLWASGDHISEGDEAAQRNELLDLPIIGNI